LVNFRLKISPLVATIFRSFSGNETSNWGTGWPNSNTWLWCRTAAGLGFESRWGKEICLCNLLLLSYKCYHFAMLIYIEFLCVFSCILRITAVTITRNWSINCLLFNRFNTFIFPWNKKVNFVPLNFFIFAPRGFLWRILRRLGRLWTPLLQTTMAVKSEVLNDELVAGVDLAQQTETQFYF